MSKNLVLPSKIRVACFDLDVVDWPHPTSSARNSWGEFSAQEFIIRVDVTTPPFKVLDTFLHEINHAIYWAYGIEDEDKEERVVATMATAWAQVYRDNPDVLELIRSCVD